MKLKLLFSSFLFAGSLNGICQTAHHNPLDDVRELACGRQAPAFLNGAAAKTTATASRIKSYLLKIYDGAVYENSDSLLLTWSGQRGGDIQGGPVKYDSYNGVKWNTATSMWENSMMSVQSFDASDNIEQTTQKIWNAVTNMWENDYRSSYVYNSGNMKTQETDQNWDAITSMWVNSYKINYTYTGNDVATETSQNWNTVTSSWENSYKKTYYYLPNGKIDYTLGQYWVGGSWQNADRSTYSYDSNGDNDVTLGQIWNNGTSSWDNYDRTTMTYSNNRMITSVRQLWNSGSSSYVNEDKSTYTYNSYNQIKTLTTESWNNGTSSWEAQTGDQKISVNYEEFTTTGVNDLASGGKIDIYPSPAQNTIHIELNWKSQQAFGIGIYDMQGRVVMQWSEPATAGYSKDISVSDLPSGNYFIRVAGEKGNLVTRIAVVH